MKKYLLIILAIIIVTGLIVSGCGKTSTTSTPATTSKPPTSTAPSSTSKPPTSTPTATSTKPPTQTTPVAGEPKYGGTFRWIADSSPAGNIGWNPTTFTVVGQYQLFDGLVKDWWNGDVTPALAASWDINDKEPSITFHLRKGVKFHDGTDFNADAVKFNYDAFMEAKAKPDWKSVDIIDDYTVKVTLNTWRNTILRDFENDPVVSPTGVRKNGVDWAMMNPVGTGPFMLESFEQDVKMVMVKNPNYWDTGKPYFDKFEIVYIPDFTTQKAAIQADEADAMLAEFGKQTSDFLNKPGFNVFAEPQASSFVVFDDANADSPFYDQKVREAVDYAIDRDWIAKNLGYGLWEPNYQLSPRTNVAYTKGYVGRQHDIAKAKQLLADAGYPTGFKTQLLPCPLGLNRDIWVAVQQQLAAVGIVAELKFLEMSAFNEYRTPGIWKNAIIADTCPSWGNMAVGLNMMFGNGPFFNSMDKNRPDWVAAITAATTSLKWTAELNRAAEQVLFKNASVIPVCNAGRGYVYRDYVKGADFGKRGSYFWAWNWESTWLDK
jgi:peptide/nickel transport system substrate-binding protein